jgi:protein-S-isoprenylcysteine O-methyltransferase Ste14
MTKEHMNREHMTKEHMSKQGMNDPQINKQQISDPQLPENGPDIPFPPAIYPALAIGASYFLQRFIALPQPVHPSFTIAGWVFFVVGIVLIGWSLSTLRKFKTTALPHQPAKFLISTGPYRFSRNPIYLAFILLTLASAVATGNLWTLLTLPFVMVLLSIYAIRPEEKHLQITFLDDYKEYARRVRRWL